MRSLSGLVFVGTLMVLIIVAALYVHAEFRYGVEVGRVVAP